MTDQPCIWCGRAWFMPTKPGEGEWVVTAATPTDHYHETIDGRT